MQRFVYSLQFILLSTFYLKDSIQNILFCALFINFLEPDRNHSIYL